MKWFYKVTQLSHKTDWQTQLDEMGRAGWELVQIMPDLTAVFKKREDSLPLHWGS